VATEVFHHGVMPYVSPADFVWGALPVSSFEPIAAARVSGVTTVNKEKIRVTFFGPMTKDAELLDETNYTLTANEGGIADLTVSLVVAPADTYPTYVDLVINEMTQGGDYTCEVSTEITDQNGDNVHPSYNSADFTGEGEPPTILTVIPTDSTTVVVTFSESMLDNADIRDVAKYSFDNDLTVVSVLDVTDDTVTLETSEQIPAVLYTLTIVP